MKDVRTFFKTLGAGLLLVLGLVFVGAATAYIHSWICGETILAIFAQIGVQGFALWQLGVVFAYLTQFIANTYVGKKDSYKVDYVQGWFVRAVMLLVIPYTAMFSGLVISLLFEEPIIRFFELFGIKGFKVYQISLWMGFMASYLFPITLIKNIPVTIIKE